jgi:hypothetical protein
MSKCRWGGRKASGWRLGGELKSRAALKSRASLRGRKRHFGGEGHPGDKVPVVGI